VERKKLFRVRSCIKASTYIAPVGVSKSIKAVCCAIKERKKSKENKSKEASDLCCLSLSLLFNCVSNQSSVVVHGIVKLNVLD
jgi:hypothetical protein